MDDNVRVLPKLIPESTVQTVLAAVHASGQWIYDWDASADRLRWVESPEGRVLGHRASDLASKGALLDLIHPDDVLTVRLGHQAVQQERDQPVAIEFRMRDAAGQWRWVESRCRLLQPHPNKPNPARFVGLLIDITARKRAESQLAMSALMLESLYDAVLVTNSDGTIRWANSAAANLLDLPLAELTGRSLNEFSGDSLERQLEIHQEIRDQVARTGLWRGRLSSVSAGRQVFSTDATVTRVAGDDGDLWIHVRRDLRERIELQRTDLQTERAAQQRLGEHLHESLSQELTAASLLLRSLDKDLPQSANQPVREVDRILRDSIAQCRELAQGISPFVLGQQGFAVALQGLAKWAEHQGAARVSVSVAGGAGNMIGNAAYLVHRVAQDILTEVCELRAGAQVDIRVWQDAGRIIASVADDVTREDSDRSAHEERMILFRAESLGATVDHVPLANGGRRVILQIPERSVETRAQRQALSA